MQTNRLRLDPELSSQTQRARDTLMAYRRISGMEQGTRAGYHPCSRACQVWDTQLSITIGQVQRPRSSLFCHLVAFCWLGTIFWETVGFLPSPVAVLCFSVEILQIPLVQFCTKLKTFQALISQGSWVKFNRALFSQILIFCFH